MSDSSEYADSDTTEDSAVFLLACLAYMESDNDLLLLLLLLMRRRLRIRNNDDSDEESSDVRSGMENSSQVSTSLVRRGTPATATSQTPITQKIKAQGTNSSTSKVTAKLNTAARCSKIPNPKLVAGQANSSTRKQANQGSNVPNAKKPAQVTTTQRIPSQGSKVTAPTPQRVVQGSKMTTSTPQRAVQGSKMITPLPQRVMMGRTNVTSTQSVNSATPKPILPASNLTVKNVEAHNATYSPWKMPPNYANFPAWSLAANNHFNMPIQSRALQPPFKIAGKADMPSQKTAAAVGVNDHVGQCQQKPPQGEEPAASGSSKRPVSILGDKEGRPMKKLKISESEGSVPEDCLQDPLEMIEIDEPTIKQEIFETEEFCEIKSEGILPNEGLDQEKVHFEEVYCTPSGTLKEEHQDDVGTTSGHNAIEIDTLVPEFMHTEIKVEPLEAEEEEDDEEEEITRDISSLLWRCPLVSCPEMFSGELEMYQHLNLNHVVKGLALSSKSKKVSGPRSAGNVSTSNTKQLSNMTSVTPPSTSPSVATSSSSGLLLFTTASSPHVPVTSVATTSQPVPSSSSGPVTVTTTFSYSSLTTSSAPLVTTVSSSSLPSVSSATLIHPATSSAPVTSSSADSTPSLPVSSPVLVLTKTNHTQPSSVSTPINLHSSISHSPNPFPATTASQGINKIIVAPISDQNCSSSVSKKFLLLTPQQQQQNLGTNAQSNLGNTYPVQSLQLFERSEPTTEDLPPCAKDHSEMFSISLARFPENVRVLIKKKMLNVVDCIRQKNISPEKLFIAYYDNSSDSRTM